MAGGAGTTQSGVLGGCGYITKKRLWLTKGDLLDYTCGRKGAGACVGNSLAGEYSTCSLNGKALLRSSGGTGGYSFSDAEGSAPTVVCSIASPDGRNNGYAKYHKHLPNPYRNVSDPRFWGEQYGEYDHTITGVLGSPDYQFIQQRDAYTFIVNDCWIFHRHGTSTWDETHFWPSYPDPGCYLSTDSNYNDKGYRCCVEWGWGNKAEFHPGWGWNNYCFKSEGTVESFKQATPGTCSGGDSASLSNTGDGYFSIKLADQNNLQFDNKTVTLPYYKDVEVQLILRDDTVVYYKRK